MPATEKDFAAVRHPVSHLIVIGMFLAGVAAVAEAQDWTRFRGPNGTGVATGGDAIPVEFGPADYNWTAELPGIGHSSPVLWGDKVFLLSADPDNATRYVICIRAADGKAAWIREFPSEPHHLHDRSSFASCTPAVDAERVYVAWSTPAKTTLMALDHVGETVWEKDLGTWQSQHGFGTSPIIYHDKVILFNSQQANQLKEGEKPGESFMMAFDRQTGKELWRTKRVSVNVCYSVPFIYEGPDGDELVCCSTGDGVFSLNPETGEENWKLADAFTMRTVASPVLAGGNIIGSTGSGGGGNYIIGVKPGKKPEEVFRIERKANYVPTPVVYGDLFFAWYDKGFVTCIDAKTGDVHWRERLDTAFSGSPIRVDDRMYCIDEEGVVFCVACDKQFKLLGKSDLGEPSRSTPAVSGGRMYLRTYSHLISVGGKSS
jgi:outer membrane protein assembly factor BamB